MKKTPLLNTLGLIFCFLTAFYLAPQGLYGWFWILFVVFMGFYTMWDKE